MTSRSALGELGSSQGLKDLATGLDACIEIVTKGKENESSWRLRRWAMALIRYVTEVHPGKVDDQLRLTKKYFARCREIAINSKQGWGSYPPLPSVSGYRQSVSRREILHQFSRVSRTLRTASDEIVQESLSSHCEISQSAWETPDPFRHRWKAFLRKHFGGNATGRFSSLSDAASFSLKKQEGGAAEEVKEITDNFRAKELSLPDIMELARRIPSFISDLVTKVVKPENVKPVMWSAERARKDGWLPKFRLDSVLFPYDVELGLSLDDWEVSREMLFSLTASWFAINWDQLPTCRQVAVRERGFKVRIATPIEACERYLLSVINRVLLNKLEETPQCVSALHGCPAEELDWSLGRRGNLVFSADLKSATDLFPQDLMMDAVDVLAEHWPQELRSLFKRSVGSYQMTSPGGEATWTTSRGILMGSPVSWPLLSMYSSWLHSESGSDGWYAVCGDDYVGCHTYPTYRRYLAARDATGAVGSPGKDILGRESVGVFAEELLTVGRCRWIPTVSVRAVLGDSKADLPGWQQGPEVAQALRRLSLTDVEVQRICMRLNGKSIQILRKAGVDPFAPRWAGGAGFPGTPSQRSLRMARMLVSQSQDFVITCVTRLMSAWRRVGSSSMLRDQVERDIARYAELSQWDSGIPGEWGPLSDVVSSRLGSLSWAYFLAGAETRVLRVKLGSIKKIITEVYTTVAARGYWVSDERIVDAKGLVEKFNELEPLIRPPLFSPLLPSIKLSGPSSLKEPFLARKRPSGPRTPEWGPKRKRSRH